MPGEPRKPLVSPSFEVSDDPRSLAVRRRVRKVLGARWAGGKKLLEEDVRLVSLESTSYIV